MNRYIILTMVVFGLAVTCFSMGMEPPGEVTWELQNSGTDAGLRGVFACTSEVVWASGSGGTWVRTVDGGRTWLSGSIPGAENLDLRDIHGFDANTAVVISVGRPGKIFLTGDGGKTWKETYHDDREGIFLNAMAFWDDRHGAVVGDPLDGRLVIILTEDGGRTWHPVEAEKIPVALPGEAQFAASGTCITVFGSDSAWICTGGGAARVFSSSDRGRSWQVAATPLEPSASSMGLFSLAFCDENTGVAVGGDYQKPDSPEQNIIITRDGGKTWKVPTTEKPSGYRSCAAFIPGTGGKALLVVGKGGADLSLDGGLNWQPVDLPGAYAVSFASDSPVGWTTGAEGRIVRVAFK